MLRRLQFRARNFFFFYIALSLFSFLLIASSSGGWTGVALVFSILPILYIVPTVTFLSRKYLSNTSGYVTILFLPSLLTLIGFTSFVLFNFSDCGDGGGSFFSYERIIIALQQLVGNDLHTFPSLCEMQPLIPWLSTISSHTYSVSFFSYLMGFIWFFQSVKRVDSLDPPSDSPRNLVLVYGITYALLAVFVLAIPALAAHKKAQEKQLWIDTQRASALDSSFLYPIRIGDFYRCSPRSRLQAKDAISIAQRVNLAKPLGGQWRISFYRQRRFENHKYVYEGCAWVVDAEKSFGFDPDLSFEGWEGVEQLVIQDDTGETILNRKPGYMRSGGND